MKRSCRTWLIAFTVEGLNIGRFVRYAGEKGIGLRELRRKSARKATALIQEKDLPCLQSLAMQGGWKLTVGERKGAGRAANVMARRWLLASCLMITMTAIFLVSQVGWHVSIIDGEEYAADIHAALTEMGMSPPVLRRNVDIGSLKEKLEWRYPRIAWFECGWRGNTLVIRPVEGNIPRKVGTYDGACDVVASRDGVIAAVVTRAGTPVVKAGDIVRKGDVLIRGEERTSEGAVKPVAARGTVRARVWRGASVRMSAIESITQYTGNEQTVWTIRTPWFDLWQMEGPGYEQFDTAVSEVAIGGIFIPMKLRVEQRMEATITRSMRDRAELEADAAAAAQRKLQEMVGSQESLIDIWGNCSMIDAENILSVAIGEMLVEIGMQVPASGMAAPGE